MFGRLVVLLDYLAPTAGAFALACHWKRRLRIPLHAIALPGWRPRSRGSEGDPLRACVALCEGQGDGLDITFTTEERLDDVWKVLHPDDLVFVGQGGPPAARTWLLRRAEDPVAPAMLTCPDHDRPLTRVLVLDRDDSSAVRFPVQAVRLAAELQAAAVVLTVGRTEKEALARQQTAQQALAREGLWADFDFVVGSDVHAAVAHVARWRRSQLVMVQRPNRSGWARWLHGSSHAQMFDELGSLAVLSLPSASSGFIDSRSEEPVTAEG